MDTSIIYIINKEYERRQKKAFEDFIEKKLTLYNKIPTLEKIDTLIAKNGIKLNKNIILKSDIEKIERINSQIDELKKEKQAILKSYNIPDNYLVKNYLCKKCSDTGRYIEEGITYNCSCYKQLLISFLYEESNLKNIEKENFSFFNDNIFETEKAKNNILAIKKYSLSYIDNFHKPETKNLLFTGKTGVGKTFICNCIAYELIEKGFTVLYLSAPVLFNILNEHKFNFNKNPNSEQIYNNVFNVELLIIDDLGTELNNSSKYTNLLSILNARENNGKNIKRTIISTNVEVKNLYKFYDERTVSRIIGSFEIVLFLGEDIRKIKR